MYLQRICYVIAFSVTMQSKKRGVLLYGPQCAHLEHALAQKIQTSSRSRNAVNDALRTNTIDSPFHASDPQRVTWSREGERAFSFLGSYKTTDQR